MCILCFVGLLFKRPESAVAHVVDTLCVSECGCYMCGLATVCCVSDKKMRSSRGECFCVSLCPRGLRVVCVGFCGPTVVCDAPLCGGFHTSLPATNPIQPAVPYLLPPAHHNIVCGVVGCGLRCVTILPVSESVFTLCVHHRGLCQTTPRSTEWLRES